MATINNILGVIPAPVAAVLMLGGFIFYALGCIRLGYGAAVKPLVLDLIERPSRRSRGQSAAQSARRGWRRCSAWPQRQQIRQTHQLGHHR